MINVKTSKDPRSAVQNGWVLIIVIVISIQNVVHRLQMQSKNNKHNKNMKEENVVKTKSVQISRSFLILCCTIFL